MQRFERQHTEDRLADKVIFDITDSLKTDNPHDCFLRLWRHAQDGNLNKYQLVVDICESLDDQVTQESSDNPNLLQGIRYGENVINFAMLMRSYGHGLHNQYSIFTSTFGGPSFSKFILYLIYCGAHSV